MDSFGSPCVATSSGVSRALRELQQKDASQSRTRERPRNTSSNPRIVKDDKEIVGTTRHRPSSTPKLRSPKLSDSTDKQRQIHKRIASKVVRSNDGEEDFFEGLERQKARRLKSAQKASKNEQRNKQLLEPNSTRRKSSSSRRDGDTMIDVYVDSSYGDEHRKAEIRRERNQRIAKIALNRSKSVTSANREDKERDLKKQSTTTVRSLSEKRNLKRSTRTVISCEDDAKGQVNEDKHDKGNGSQIIDLNVLDCLRASGTRRTVSIGSRFTDCLLVTADALGDDSSYEDQDDALTTPSFRKSKAANADANTLSTANSSFDSPTTPKKTKSSIHDQNRSRDQSESRMSASVVPSSSMSGSGSVDKSGRQLLNLSTSVHSSSIHSTSKRPPLVLSISTDELVKHGEMHRKYRDRCSPQKAKPALGVEPNEPQIQLYNPKMSRVPATSNDSATLGNKSQLQSMTFRNAHRGHVGDAKGQPRNFYSRKYGDECSIPFDEQSGNIESCGPDKPLRRPRRPGAWKQGEEIPFDECSGPKTPMPQNIPYLVYNFRSHPSGYGFLGTPTLLNPAKLPVNNTAPPHTGALQNALDPTRSSNHGYNHTNPNAVHAKLNNAPMTSSQVLRENLTPIHQKLNNEQMKSFQVQRENLTLIHPSHNVLVRKYDNCGNTLTHHLQPEVAPLLARSHNSGAESSNHFDASNMPKENISTLHKAIQIANAPTTDLPPDTKSRIGIREEKIFTVADDMETKYQSALKDLEAQDQIIQKLMSEYKKTRQVLSQMQMEITATKEEPVMRAMTPTRQQLVQIETNATVQDFLDADDKLIAELNTNQSLVKKFNDLKEQTKNLKGWLSNPKEPTADETSTEVPRCGNSKATSETPERQNEVKNEQVTVRSSPPTTVSFIADIPSNHTDELNYSFSTIGQNGSVYSSEQDHIARLQAEITEARSNRLQTVERLVTISRCQTPTDFDTKSLQKRFENIKKCRSSNSTCSNNGSVASSITKIKHPTGTSTGTSSCINSSTASSKRISSSSSQVIATNSSHLKEPQTIQYESTIRHDDSFQSIETGLSSTSISTSSSVRKERVELELLRQQVASLSSRLKLTNGLCTVHQRKALTLQNELQSTRTDATTLRTQVESLLTELTMSKQEYDEKSIDTASCAKSLQDEVNRIKQTVKR